MTGMNMIKLPTLESIPKNSNDFSLYRKESAILDELVSSEMATRFVGLVIAITIESGLPAKVRLEERTLAEGCLPGLNCKIQLHSRTNLKHNSTFTNFC